MNIELTNRNTKKLYSLKSNVIDFTQISSLEKQIEGAVIHNNSEYINLRESQKILKDYFVENMSINPEAFDKSIPFLKPIYAMDFLKNPYIKDISLPHLSIGDFKLESASYQKHEFTMLNEPMQHQDLKRQYPIGVFDNHAQAYVLKNRDFAWTSICPMVINSMEKSIDDASGSVLVLGGDLAYYPYMVSLKDSVSDITIVEKNPIVYEIITTYILPQFSRNICRIVLDDAEAFIKNNNLSDYNTIFMNMWEDSLVGAKYYKDFVKYELEYPESKFQYWLEDSILDTFVVNIFEYFCVKIGTKESQDLFQRIAPDLWSYMENIDVDIKRPEQFDYYLTRKFAKSYLLGINPA